MTDSFGGVEPTGDATFPDEDEFEARVRTPVTARGVAIVGGRVVLSLVGVGVAAVTIAAAAFVPLPSLTAAAPSTVIVPALTAQQLVCPGAVLRLSDDSGQGATDSSMVGRPAVTSYASAGDLESAPVGDSDASSGGTASAPTVIGSPPNEADPDQRVLLSGSQVQRVNQGDFFGLAAAGCAPANGESWLAGGSTEVGRTTLITLTNPSDVPATVDLEIFAESGEITAPGTAGLVVPASGQRVLSLAGFAPGVVSPVVHVTSSGGQVLASLQQSIVRGLRPGGVEIIESTPALSDDVVIPGLLITDAEAVQELRGSEPGYEDVGTVLRLFTPGSGTVPMTVSVTPEDGADGTSFALDVEAGRVTDVPIDELASGSYTVRVESDAPALAAVRATAVKGSASDFAWFAASSPISTEAQVTIPAGPSPVLHLANPTDADALVAVTPSAGAATSVVVAAGTSLLVPVVAGRTYQLSGFDRLLASVSLAGNGTLARFAVTPPGAASSPITVYP